MKWTFPSTLLINCQSYSSGLTYSYSALTFLSMWSLIRLSDLLPVHQDPINKLNFCLTFWCSSTSGSSVSVSYTTGCSWSLRIYQNPYFARRYPTSACLCVEDILQPWPLAVCLFTVCRTLSKSFLECSGPSFAVLDNCLFFQNTKYLCRTNLML